MSKQTVILSRFFVYKIRRLSYNNCLFICHGCAKFKAYSGYEITRFYEIYENDFKDGFVYLVKSRNLVPPSVTIFNFNRHIR